MLAMGGKGKENSWTKPMLVLDYQYKQRTCDEPNYSSRCHGILDV